MPEKVLGIDIGPTSVKAVQVSGGLRGLQVAAFAHVPMDQEGGIKEALAKLSEAMSFQGGVCVASFPGDQVSYRNLQMPFNDKKKIGQTIRYELEPLVPFSVETIATDYIITDDSEQTQVLSASVQVEELGEALAVLAEHNLDPDVIDVGGVVTTLHMMREAETPQDGLLIDIGTTETLLVLFVRRNIVLVRSLHFGGQHMTEAIAQSQGVDREAAERLKRQDREGRLSEPVRKVVEAFCRQALNTLHAFRCEMSWEMTPEKVYLTGGGALYPGIGGMLEGFLGLPVELVNLAKRSRVEIPENLSTGWTPLLMDSALALALRDTKAAEGFNFRVGPFKKKKRYDQYSAEIKRIAVYAGLVMLAAVASFSADYFTLYRQNGAIQEQMTALFKQAFPGAQRVVDPVHQMKVKIGEAKASGLLPAEMLSRAPTVDVIRDMILRIPKTAQVDVSDVIIDEERARLKGDTDNFNTVDAIKGGLQESEYFQNVEIAAAQLDRSGEKVRFELKMERR